MLGEYGQPIGYVGSDPIPPFSGFEFFLSAQSVSFGVEKFTMRYYPWAIAPGPVRIAIIVVGMKSLYQVGCVTCIHFLKFEGIQHVYNKHKKKAPLMRGFSSEIGS